MENKAGENPPLSKEKKRLLQKEVLLLILFTGILLFFEYAEPILGRAYLYVAPAVWWTYTVAILVLFLLTVLFNRGLDSRIPTEEDLKPTMTAEEKQRSIARCTRDKAIARGLISYLFPLFGAWLIDLLYIYFL